MNQPRAGKVQSVGPVRRFIAKMALGSGWTEFLKGAWTSGRSASEVTAPFSQCSAAYSGVKVIAQTVGGFPLKLYSGERDNIIESGPAFELLNQPVRGLTTAQWLEQMCGHYVASGEFHVVLEGPPGGRPRNLPVFGKPNMQPEFGGNGDLVWWWLARQRKPNVRVLPEDDAFARMLNPDDELRGLSPLEAAGLAIKQDYNGALFNASALANGSHPSSL